MSKKHEEVGSQSEELGKKPGDSSSSLAPHWLTVNRPVVLLVLNPVMIMSYAPTATLEPALVLTASIAMMAMSQKTGGINVRPWFYML